MIVPTGAVSVNSVLVPGCCQNEASDCLGGRQLTMAGVAVLLLLSETSRLEICEATDPIHSTEHVATEPCAGGGAHIRNLFTFTDWNMHATAVLPVLHTVPAAPSKDVGVIAVAVAEVLVKR